MKKLPKVNIHVCTKDGVVPYDSLSYEEKNSLAISMNRRAIRAAASVEGFDVEFFDPPVMETGTK
ncbi:hypothetical protein [Anaerotignum sp.]|uniref:hypothetical protein n=1 Tax=Anaerotignum sp. TaxID=2039241 RepID=UPI0027152BC5|nr:hypothetical protein [Anaerotignum sp.]